MPYYIAGIHMPIDHNRGVEAVVVTSVALALAHVFYNQVKNLRHANADGGSIISMPSSFLGSIVTPIHAAAILLPPLVYSVSTIANNLVQPEWYEKASFSVEADITVGIGGKAALRMLACTGVILTSLFTSATMKVLGRSFHAVGVREKGQVVSSGPYAYIRHPLYTSALALTTSLSVATWNWIPLVCTGITMICFAIKMPIEEKLIEDDAAMGAAYKEYEKKVVYRIIPFIW